MRIVVTSRLLALVLIGLTIFAFLCPKTSLATETDPYTYSCIKLEDSAPKINYMLNGILRETFAKANAEILKYGKRTDTYAEFYFSHFYYKKMFVDDYGKEAFSPFETCIDTNTCEGWPYFERIYLKPEESIYYEADYSFITKKYMASTVNVCGVYMGTDKLTHFLKDAFRLYNAKKFGASDEDILKYATISENTFFGKVSTGVFSYADIVANTNGVKFFEDIFARHVVQKKNGLLDFSDINICDYVSNKFSERVSKNVYTVSKQKVDRLKNAMKNRLLQCTDKNREEILARKSDPVSVPKVEGFRVGIINAPSFVYSDFRAASEILIKSAPLFEGRMSTNIPKEK